MRLERHTLLFLVVFVDWQHVNAIIGDHVLILSAVVLTTEPMDRYIYTIHVSVECHEQQRCATVRLNKRSLDDT